MALSNGAYDERDRRQEPRFRCGYYPIHWCAGPQDFQRPGHMFDVSATGLAYQTLGSGRPDVGDHVLILAGRRSPPVNCQVMRATRQDDGRYVVGCRRLEDVQTPALVAPEPPARSWRQEPHRRAGAMSRLAS